MRKESVSSLVFVIIAAAWDVQAVGAHSLCLGREEGVRRGCVRQVSGDTDCDPPVTYGFREGSCLVDESGVMEPVLSEVLALSDGDVLPTGIWDRYTSREVARAVVFRKFMKEAAEQTEEDFLNPQFDFFVDAEIQYAFKAPVTAGILERGILNQHQIERSTGYYRPEARAALEDGLAGLRIEEAYTRENPERPANELRPKYAFFGIQKFGPGVDPGVEEGGYGDVFAVFKEHVKHRTMFSNGDTINFEKSSLLEIHTLKLLRRLIEMPRLGPYYEAQVWGKLTIEEDVDHFLVNCPGFYKTGPEFFAAYHASGIQVPVYECESIEPSWGAKVIRAKRRSAPQS